MHAALTALGRWAAGDHGHGHRPGASWVATSWALSITHLGMLESRRTLGAANMVTLARANLPAVVTVVRPGDARAPQAMVLQVKVPQAKVPQAKVLAAAALASDLVDGHLARRWGTTTPFGRYADSIADAAFWTWFVLCHEPDRRVRLLALGAWVFPVVAVMAISLARGRMIDAPSPVIVRPAAVMQVVLAARAIGRSRRFAPTCSSSP
jgi:phosphatidylglycerophosphate synthase